MRDRSGIFHFFLFGFVLLFAGILLAQNKPDRALIVNGKSAGMAMQVDGHAYIEVETVAQFTHGIVTFEPNRIVLTFPAPGTSMAPTATPAPLPPPGLSRNFASAAIAELAEMREWRGAVSTILTYGSTVVGNWPQDYHDHVDSSLMQGGRDNRCRPGRDATPPERIFKPRAVGH